MDTATDKSNSGIATIWLDVLAFGIGLSLAWWLKWKTTDLVWSLWLSSLLVGYAMIVNNLIGGAVRLGLEARSNGGSLGASAAIFGVAAFGAAFLLVFFTVHFGFFHLIHSVFLNSFFPIASTRGFPSFAAYREVFLRYWYFVPVAALAERQAFLPRRPPAASVPAGDVSQRLASMRSGDAMMQPYLNVIRMHMLIFFFAFAHFVGLENFYVYAVVYAVYFFPWRIFKRVGGEAKGAPATT